MNVRGLSGKYYKLDSSPFGGGGEGDIYEIIGDNDRCAKIYNSGARKKETEKKLIVMVKNIPNKAVLSQIAWPLDILYDTVGTFIGFVMPKINVSDELTFVYSYGSAKYKQLSFEQKMIIAQNICAVIDAVHRAGFVFGDFNPANIGVDMNTGHVAFWDTDSYHIYDKATGTTYRCKVCLDGYVAPELLAKFKNTNYTYETAPLETFTQETDNFALAIHIFRLFMNGYTPFAGITANQSLSTVIPGIGNKAIEMDQYCFKPGNVHMSPAVPDKSVFPKEIIDLFDKAFIDGRQNPKLRPTAREWHAAIERFYSMLKQCKVNPAHQYMKGLRTCPWCEIDKKFNAGINMAKKQTVSQNTSVTPPALTNAGTYTKVQKNQQPSRKQTIRGELIALVVFVVVLLSFCIIQNVRWSKKMTPAGSNVVETVLTGDMPFNTLVYSGSFDSSNKENSFSFIVDDGPSCSKSQSVTIRTITSNSGGVNIDLLNQSGRVIAQFDSSDDTLDSNKYEIELDTEQKYTIKVKRKNVDTDFTIHISRN